MEEEEKKRGQRQTSKRDKRSEIRVGDHRIPIISRNSQRKETLIKVICDFFSSGGHVVMVVCELLSFMAHSKTYCFMSLWLHGCSHVQTACG